MKKFTLIERVPRLIGRWYFAAVTVRKKGADSEILFFLNGNEIGRHQKVYTPVDSKSNRLHIGVSSDQLQLKNQIKKDHMEFEGHIDEFFLLPSVISPEVIIKLYKSGIKK